MTIGNGPVGGDGQTRLLYTIENIKRDEICQNEDTVALPPSATLRSVFFSDSGVSAMHTFSQSYCIKI
jgi:chromosome transmission fidelity protein 4